MTEDIPEIMSAVVEALPQPSPGVGNPLLKKQGVLQVS